MLTFDQERLNELQLYVTEGPEATRGFRTILTGPAHPPYAQFTPVAGHQLGFNELKVIEAKHLLDCIAEWPRVLRQFCRGPQDRTRHPRHGALGRESAMNGWV